MLFDFIALLDVILISMHQVQNEGSSKVEDLNPIKLLSVIHFYNYKQIEITFDLGSKCRMVRSLMDLGNKSVQNVNLYQTVSDT